MISMAPVLQISTTSSFYESYSAKIFNLSLQRWQNKCWVRQWPTSWWLLFLLFFFLLLLLLVSLLCKKSNRDRQSDSIVHVVYKTSPHKQSSLWGVWFHGKIWIKSEMGFFFLCLFLEKNGIHLREMLLNCNMTGYYMIKYCNRCVKQLSTGNSPQY